MEYTKYLVDLYDIVPVWGYKCLLLIVVITVIISLFIKNSKTKFLLLAGTLLAEYVIWLYSSTVIFRPFKEDYGYNLTPFWSYINPFDKNQNLLLEDFFNVLLFVPFGGLLAFVFKSVRWRIILLVNILVSVSIEIFQFLYCKGFLEFDDIFHNVIGGMIGYGTCFGATLLYKYYKY